MPYYNHKKSRPSLHLNLHSSSLLNVLLIIAMSLCLSCSERIEQPADARRVTTRTDLVGGPSALGELGDIVLENGEIKVIIQDKGFSRGFGVYGGGIIDADLVRPTAPGNSDGANGRDSFGELFPVYFLQALNPQEIKVLPNSDEGAAQVQVSGPGGEFLSITKVLNRILLNSYDGVDGFESIGELLPLITGEEGLSALLGDSPRLTFEVLYSLMPGARHINIATSMINTDDSDIELPSDVANQLFNFPAFSGLARDPFQVPLGFVALFGAGNQVFAPGFGFDIRFALEDRYQKAAEFSTEGETSPLALPALPGLITPGLISINPEGVSYGLFYLPEDIKDEAGESSYPKSFAYNLPDLREDSESFGRNVYELVFGDKVQPGDSLIPFSASSFTGMFSAGTPSIIKPNERFTMHHAFFVGDGDVSSIMDAYYEMMSIPTEPVILEVFDEVSGALVSEASILIYDANQRLINQSFSRSAGLAKLQLPIGEYSLRVHRGPSLSEAVPLSVKKDGMAARLTAPSPARLHFDIRGVDNRPLPAKVTIVGTTPAEQSGQPLRNFLFDLEAGQRWRTDDLVPDNPNEPSTRRYIETEGFTQQGVVSIDVPAGDYEVYISRGTEYELKVLSVSLDAGEEQGITEVLSRQVETPGYISADFHLHAAPSLDSDLPLRRRVRTAAAEGLEHLVATDHNFVTDYQPFIEREGLTEWLSSMIGLELTTLEAGHFNTFPIKRDKSQITRGAFQWSDQTPQALFEHAKEIGDENTIIQVNHPRDLILGYFSQYGVDPLTGELPEPSSGGGGIGAILDGLLAPNGPAFFDDEGNSEYSDQFDVIEVLNHGLFHEEFHARMPANIGEATIYDDNGNPLTPEEVAEIPVGEIICDGDDVAYAGAIDDWFNMLNNGKRYGGTANSDSHHGDDIGYPRTYVYVGDDDPAKVRYKDVAKGVRNKQMTMSRGPFLEFFVNEEPIGSDIVAMSGEVELKVKVSAPRWIEVNRGVIYANGEVLTRFEVDIDPETHLFEWSQTIELTRDTWFIAQVRGDRSMFPVAPPIDLPPVLLNEAFGTIAGPLGLGGGPFDEIAPKMTGAFTPLALSNPIWVDIDGEGFKAPGVLPRKCDGYTVVPDVMASPLVRETDADDAPIRLWEEPEESFLPPLLPPPARQARNRHTLARSFGFPRVRGELNDVRLIFEHFGSHSH